MKSELHVNLESSSVTQCFLFWFSNMLIHLMYGQHFSKSKSSYCTLSRCADVFLNANDIRGLHVFISKWNEQSKSSTKRSEVSASIKVLILTLKSSHSCKILQCADANMLTDKRWTLNFELITMWSVVQGMRAAHWDSLFFAGLRKTQISLSFFCG